MVQTAKVLTYAPDCWCYVATDSGVLDLSADIIRGQVQRVENSISQASFVVNNKNARYSNVIKPMDRIVVFLKRVVKLQVFSGYVNSAPFIDLYPTIATINASCTLKRLQHTWWNPGLVSSATLLDQKQYVQGQTDQGLGKMLVEVLAQVANWDRNQIHIQQIPKAFVNFAQNFIDQQATIKGIAALKSLLGIQDGTGTTGSTTLVGNSNAQRVFNFLVSKGLAQFQAAGVIGNLMQESGCDPNSVQSGGPGRGIAQWSLGGRWSGVIALAAKEGKQPTDLGVQCDYLWQELTTTEAGSLSALKATTNVVGATQSFEQNYERAGTSNMANRIQQAQNALASFGGANGTGPASSTGTVNSGGADPPTFNATNPSNPTSSAASSVNTALSFALAQVGKPYIWGGVGPTGYDCSGLLQAAYKNAGITIPRTSQQQATFGTPIPDIASALPGDLIFPFAAEDHVVMYLGNNQIVEAAHTGTNIRVTAVYASAGGIRRIVAGGGSAVADAAAGATGGVIQDPAIAGLFNVIFQLPQFVDANALLYTGRLSLADAQQLLPMIQAIAKGGLRSFQSGPDGSFVGYYPDYFGIQGTSTKYIVEDIEIKDFTVVKNDNSFTTHVFAAPDNISGGYGSTFGTGSEFTLWLRSSGVVTIEDAALLKTMLNIDPTTQPEFQPANIYAKYGARPLKVEFPSLKSEDMAFFEAFHIFMQKWSEQYATTVELTFMPELYPGMRVELGGHNLSVYVAGVTHTFDRAAGFSTTLVISSPSTVQGGIPGLPIAGTTVGG